MEMKRTIFSISFYLCPPKEQTYEELDKDASWFTTSLLLVGLYGK